MLLSLRRRFAPSRLLLIAFLAAIGIFMLLPIIFLVNNAFKPLNEMFVFPPRIFVQQPTMYNFEQLFLHSAAGVVPFSRYLFNSVVIATATTLAVIVVSTMAGYVLSKHRFHFKAFIMGAVMIALMFTPETVSIPRYLIVSGLGLKDTYLAHVLPFLASPVAVFLMKQFIDQIPNSLIEAAKLDGASRTRSFFNVTLPMITPTIFLTVVMTVIGSLKVFGQIFVMTQGGPSNSTKVLVYYIWEKAFKLFQLGYASALAFVLFFVVLVLTLVQWQLRKRWVFNESDA